MSSALSAIPPARRRRLAATLGLFAMLFLAVGLVACTGPDTVAVRVFAIVALTASGLLALVAWGVAHSVRADARPARPGCSCGHDHDLAETTVVDACRHDGQGVECAHDCDSCSLAALRPSPTTRRAERLPH